MKKDFVYSRLLPFSSLFFLHSSGQKGMNASEEARETRNVAELTEQTKANRLDARLLKISGKFRRRTNASGYHSIMDVWVDLYPCIQVACTFESWWAMQYMLRITGEFHEYCDGFREADDIAQMASMFDELEKAWLVLLEREAVSTTDKIRSINLFRDGQDKAEVLGVQGVYQRVVKVLTAQQAIA
ncbi:hypothetical protein BGW37DRAFT_74233 [Umbelopsis sp. PMI_123]|nr:hypothetical protein BGW37DRAFT_74233 [Umbelopsis sp. PMI_123]